jgi:hypothetical protein
VILISQFVVFQIRDRKEEKEFCEQLDEEE